MIVHFIQAVRDEPLNKISKGLLRYRSSFDRIRMNGKTAKSKIVACFCNRSPSVSLQLPDQPEGR